MHEAHNFIYNFPFFCIILTMVGGVAMPFIRNGWIAQKINMGIIAAVGGMNVAVLCQLMVDGGKTVTYMMGHFPAPFGNEIRFGPMEAIMALCFCLVMGMSILGGLKDIYHDVRKGKQNLYFLMINLLLCSLLALIYTNDMFTGYVFIEINTIAACAIVMSKDSGETIVATIRYLIMSLLGSGLFLMGISMLYGITGHLLMVPLKDSIGDLVTSGQYAIPLTVIIGLISLGVAIKSALYPFHSWLPGAHGSATTSSSAILSGLVLKGYIILLIKVIYRVVTPEVMAELQITNVLLVFGVVGMIMGSVRALKERHIKRMIAYSSVAQIGYIFMGIGLGSTVGIMAACFHILSHAFTKPMLFCSAGALVDASGHNYDFKKLRGSALKNPLAGIAFTVGGLSMIGIPLMAGFPSKLYFSTGAIQGDWFRLGVVLTALAISTVLNALYYLPAIINMWTPKKSQEASHGHDHGDAHGAHDAHGGDAHGHAEELANVEDHEDEHEEVHEKPRITVSFVVSMVIFLASNFALGIFYQPLMNIIEQGISVL